MPLANPGAISNVSNGGALDPDWGNAIRDRVVNVFANATARDAAITAPVEGMACWLADVDQFLVYNGVAWRKPWNAAWGIQGTPAIVTSDQTGITTVTDVTSAAVTFTAVANRLYKVHFACQVGNTNAASGNVITICNAANTVLHTARSRAVAAGGAGEQLSSFTIIGGTGAGSTTFKLRATAAANTMSVLGSTGGPTVLVVEDIGPNGAAA